MIKISSLVHKYTIWQDENIKSEKTALDGISLDIPSGQFLAILGPNGSGKSTLAKHLNVLLLPNEGTVWIEGNDTAAKEKLWEIRSQVGMVFQNPDNQIIGTSVEEDVAFGPENKNIESEKIRKNKKNRKKCIVKSGTLEQKEIFANEIIRRAKTETCNCRCTCKQPWMSRFR